MQKPVREMSGLVSPGNPVALSNHHSEAGGRRDPGGRSVAPLEDLKIRRSKPAISHQAMSIIDLVLAEDAKR